MINKLKNFLLKVNKKLRRKKSIQDYGKLWIFIASKKALKLNMRINWII